MSRENADLGRGTRLGKRSFRKAFLKKQRLSGDLPGKRTRGCKCLTLLGAILACSENSKKASTPGMLQTESFQMSLEESAVTRFLRVFSILIRSSAYVLVDWEATGEFQARKLLIWSVF